MKNLKISILVGLLTPALLFGAGGEKRKNQAKPLPGTAAGCAPASKLIFLEFNNVRTRVEAGGIWWQDRANGVADYEVPRGSNSFALYAGGLWLAGTDVNGQLKAAVSLFGNGVDYYTGPLSTTGDAEIIPEDCEAYDRFFELTKAEVTLFNAYNIALSEGTAGEDFKDYQIPTVIQEWPGNGDLTKDQDFRLAPYMNVAGDESYEPELGDYPFYDLVGDVDCREFNEDRSISGRRPLFGDKTYWWIFNDKGNLHTESNAPSIGMEIHGQAFAFATNDEINNMTFYNFELINRSTFTLTNTYFASYVDPDVGDATDDYVGCDVERGLGYAFNGVEFDPGQGGQTGYGANPPAIGIDFFEGPYQDLDGLNNSYGIGPGEALNGLGYFNPNDQEPDMIVDNERFGMRRFVFYNIGSGPIGDPDLAVHYYNYMRGIWKNGRRMRHGGNGFNSAGVEDIPTDFMFPGTSDPLHWGTTDENGFTTVPNNLNWSEDNPGGGEPQNPDGDRRFLQSAGPFTLRPGNVNDITVGVVFAQAQDGGRLASVQDLFTADDKAQALFDNCFKVLNGPDSPDLNFQELDEELIVYISNPSSSNNANETHEEKDPRIVTPDSLADLGIFYDDKYRFQGYQVYQVADEDVAGNDLEDPTKARLIFQCDIKDGVSSLVNFEFDRDIQANVPTLKVNGADEGIQRSFSVNTDAFADGDAALVNYKTYYFIAIAYGYNEFKPYIQGVAPDPVNPFAGAFDGQTEPYIGSRKSGLGGEIRRFTAIPHPPVFSNGGTVFNSTYGDGLGITRIQGTGNGGRELTITEESLAQILADKDWISQDSTVNSISYTADGAPFEVTIVDPLNVQEGEYFVQFQDTSINSANGVTDSSYWRLWRRGGVDTVEADKYIIDENQQLIVSRPNLGLAITIKDGVEPGSLVPNTGNGFISASIDFEDVESQWLSGIPDSDREDPFNWILSGVADQSPSGFFIDYAGDNGAPFRDPDQDFEDILGGTIAPYGLTRYEIGLGDPAALNAPARDLSDVRRSTLDRLMSIQLVITDNKDLWTRCPVIETKDDGLADPNNPNVLLHAKNQVKVTRLSVDKDGNPVDTTGFGNLTLTEIQDTLNAMGDTLESDAAFINAFGMGWFPGYVINKETGDRLNMAFGEDTRYSLNNGDDMLWNPTSVVAEGIDPSFISQVWGGKHYIYIFRETEEEEADADPIMDRFNARMPIYDFGKQARRLLGLQGGGLNGVLTQRGWGSCAWVSVPLVEFGETLLSNDVEINVNVSKSFAVKQTSIREGEAKLNQVLENEGAPVYKFNTFGKGAFENQTNVLESQLDELNVVPNPYYSQSGYESNQLDNIVKFTNLPETCTITIYNSFGTLIRRYNKSSPDGFLDWDLTNQVGVPIASGVYIVHIEVPNVGEKIIKWFGTVRPADFTNF